jgi:CheY-like chemotaxis protein
MTQVLITEDNALSRELLRELPEMGRNDVLDATQPDILLLEFGMPALNGFAHLDAGAARSSM